MEYFNNGYYGKIIFSRRDVVVYSEAHKNGWSRAMVLNQMAVKAYERSLIEPSTTSIVKSDGLANELFKDTYVQE